MRFVLFLAPCVWKMCGRPHNPVGERAGAHLFRKDRMLTKTGGASLVAPG